MKLKLKITFILVALFLSAQALAYTSDYVPAFKVVEKSENISEFQDNLKKEVFQLRSIMNVQEKNIVGHLKDSEDLEKRTPATDI